MKRKIFTFLKLLVFFCFSIKVTYAAVDPVPDLKDLEGVFVNALRGVFGIAGIGALAMIIVGGFRYAAASGDEKVLKDAAKTVSYAVIGLVLMVASYFIMEFIGTNIFGAKGW